MKKDEQTELDSGKEDFFFRMGSTLIHAGRIANMLKAIYLFTFK